MAREVLTTHQKALQINLTPPDTAASAEIGAGQEVAVRSSTLAARPAPSPIHSRLRHGHQRRRLSPCPALRQPPARWNHVRPRVQPMFDALRTSTAPAPRFLSLPDTVVARSYSRHDDTHGWLGLDFKPLRGKTVPNHPSMCGLGQGSSCGTGSHWPGGRQPHSRRLVPPQRPRHTHPIARGQHRRRTDRGRYGPVQRPRLFAGGQPLDGPPIGRGRLDQCRFVHRRWAEQSNPPRPFTKNASWSSVAASGPLPT